MRNMEDYSKKYSVPSFENYQVLYRRKKVLEVIEHFAPQNILEIGCGNEPLFQYVKNSRFTVVEPAQKFFDNAVALANGSERINCIHGFFEDVVKEISDDYDMILCSGLLNEVEDPNGLLRAIVRVCNKNTLVHINVPNANSMHRLLAKEMGILQSVYDFSQNNIDLQQHYVFDCKELRKITKSNGFEIMEEGSYFIKPFAHNQMFQMMEKEIISEAVLEGLYKFVKYMPEFGSEIYVNCKLKR